MRLLRYAMNDLKFAFRDFRFAVRGALRTPGFSLAVIAALALGIGPNTAIFSVVYATLLAPIPYPDPDQLVLIWSQVRGNRDGTSPADYLEWKEQATSFQYLEPILPRGFNLSTPEAPERVRARQTSTNGHRMWGETVWLGRDFAPDEDQPGWRRMKCGTSGRSKGSSSSGGIFGSPFAARCPWASGQTQPSSRSLKPRSLG